MIEAMAKHLPPAAANPHVLDINGEAGETLLTLRDDLQVETVTGNASAWTFDADSVDAVVAFDYVLNDDFLARVLNIMRPGGRLIVIDPRGNATRPGLLEDAGRRLESAGYVRILTEAAASGAGVLMRGEKAHTTADTLQRIQQVAGQEAGTLDLSTFKGRYVHLLVEQSPNKPVWRMEPDEVVEWFALAIRNEGSIPSLLAFSSLPKAVSFMQSAILAGCLSQVNKVGKFSKAAAAGWTEGVIVNPALDVFETGDMLRVEVDPAMAEAPDE